MVDFRKLDKIWKKRPEKSDVELRIKFIRDACSTLADICRLAVNDKRTSSIIEGEAILKSFRDTFRSFIRSKGQQQNESSQSINTSSPVAVQQSQPQLQNAGVCSTNNTTSGDSKSAVLLETIISQSCDMCTDIECRRQASIKCLKEIGDQSSEISDCIRREIQDRRQQYDVALLAHKRAQHTLDKLRQSLDDSVECGYTAETATKLNNASDNEYQASRELDVQCERLQADIIRHASDELAVSKLFVNFMEMQMDALVDIVGIFNSYLPQFKKQIDEYLFQPLFGLDLELHLQLYRCKISYVIETCISLLNTDTALTTEGLLRVTPNSAKLRKMVVELNTGRIENLSEPYDYHVIAGALKQYLRSLPKSLMVASTPAKVWQEVSRITDENEKIKAIRDLLDALPRSYLQNLRYVFQFLLRITSFEKVNRMNANNVAICMACSLCFNEKDRKTISSAPALIAFVITNFEFVFADRLSITDETTSNGFANPKHSQSIDVECSVSQPHSPTVTRCRQPGMGSLVNPLLKQRSLIETSSFDILKYNSESDHMINVMDGGGGSLFASVKRASNADSPKKRPAPPPPRQSYRSENINCDSQSIAFSQLNVSANRPSKLLQSISVDEIVSKESVQSTDTDQCAAHSVTEQSHLPDCPVECLSQTVDSVHQTDHNEKMKSNST